MRGTALGLCAAWALMGLTYAESEREVREREGLRVELPEPERATFVVPLDLLSALSALPGLPDTSSEDATHEATPDRYVRF
ncbi:MAG: hypothetical protein AAF430_08905 [Myxococcota bacterium]